MRRLSVALRRASVTVVVAIVAVAGVRAHAEDDPGQTRWLRYLMGTAIRVEVHDGSAAERRQAADEAFGALGEVDRLMSNYRNDSELTHLNQTAASANVPVSAPMLAVLQAAERVSRASSGAFDVTVGPLVSLWGFKDKRPHVPTPGELARVRDVIGYQLVTIDGEAGTVSFARPGVEIDLGGIAKGFGVELAAASLRRRGLNGLIDAGGNQYFVGRPAGKSAWSVGIRHPDRADALLGTIDIPEGSLSTSADSSNFLVADGRKYGHLLDPRTLQPADASLSVTIVSADGTLADALSKAVFVLGPKQGLKLLESFPGTAALIAYREDGGGVGLAISPGLTFHPSR